MVGKKRLSMGLVLTLFLCLAAIGTTFAYLYSETNILTNAFSIGKLPIEVIENEKKAGDEQENIVPDTDKNKAEKKVQIKNDSDDMQAYIRVSLIPSLREGTGTQTESKLCNVEYNLSNWAIQCSAYENPADKTERTTLFTLVLDQATRNQWLYDAGTNAFYYKHPVSPKGSTDLLLAEVTRTVGDWDRLNVEVLADSIQADFEGEGEHPVSLQWPVVIGADGTLSLKP